MKISEITNLTEAKTADLYHGTHPVEANKILASNTMKANAPIWTNVIQHMRVKPGQENKTVSFSRSLSSARSFASGAASKLGMSGVIFVIDQGLLSRDVGKRLMPYNDIHSGHALKPGEGRNVTTEYEEAVVGDINNINKYIKKILIFIDPVRKDLINKEKFPYLLNDPRVEFVTAIHGSKKSGRGLTPYDIYPTAREIDRKPRLSL